MSTSGTTTFSQTRDQIILDALSLIGVYGIGRTVSAADMDICQRLLNKMIKAWGAKGLHLWAKEEGVLFITPNTASYLLGNASTDAKVTNISDLVMTQTAAAYVANDTALTVTSTTNMTVGDYIGVVLTDKTLHWTTIATIPTSTTLTLTTGLLSAASSGAYVYTFTNKIYKPLRVLSCRIRSGIDLGSTSTEVDIPMTMISHSDYYNMAVKSIGGIPNQAHYLPDLTNGTLTLYPRPQDCSYRIHFTYERVLEDLSSAANDFDFPVEWEEALTYQAAIRFGAVFGKTKKAQALMPMAEAMLQDLLSWDSEITSVCISPDIGFNYGGDD